MDKIKTLLKETNGLAIFSFLIAVFALVYGLYIIHECNTTGLNLIGIGAVFMGIIALIWIKVKKQKGKWFAILGIIIGLLDAGLVSLC